MAAGIKSISKTAVWVLLGLLILGLAGFGATNLSGTIRTVGHVGDEVISVDDFARELQREIRGIEAQTRQPLPMDQVRAIGLDQVVLSRLVALAALDDEVSRLGLSVGDENLQREITRIPAFQGISGQFDRETYRFTLNQNNIRETDFEEDLRAESARTMVQRAIVSGVRMPTVLSDTLTDYLAARRAITWARLDDSALTTPVAEPTEAELRAFHEAAPDDFRLPETKRLTYVLLTPEMILDAVEVEEDAVRQLYADRKAEYDLPERRLVERLVFSDEATASDAMAQLDVGGTTFAALVESRGLSLDDIDIGDVTRDDLGAAADAVFAAESGAVIGPLPSSLGPALFRVNGILAARSTPFEEVAADLRDELAAERARRDIEGRAQPLDDLLAGGATLEDLAGESDMQLGTLDWSAEAAEGPAAYEAFNAAAKAVTLEDFPSIGYLEDGGLFALRLDEVLPPRPEPFEQAREAVAEAWSREQTMTALRARAEAIVAAYATSGDLAASGLDLRVEPGLTRTAFVGGAPRTFMSEVFEMAPGDLRVIDAGDAVLIVRLDEALPPEQTSDLADLRQSLSESLNQSLSSALFETFVRDAQLRARPRIDQQALNAVLAGFQ